MRKLSACWVTVILVMKIWTTRLSAETTTTTVSPSSISTTEATTETSSSATQPIADPTTAIAVTTQPTTHLATTSSETSITSTTPSMTTGTNTTEISSVSTTTPTTQETMTTTTTTEMPISETTSTATNDSEDTTLSMTTVTSNVTEPETTTTSTTTDSQNTTLSTTETPTTTTTQISNQSTVTSATTITTTTTVITTVTSNITENVTTTPSENTTSITNSISISPTPSSSSSTSVSSLQQTTTTVTPSTVQAPAISSEVTTTLSALPSSGYSPETTLITYSLPVSFTTSASETQSASYFTESSTSPMSTYEIVSTYVVSSTSTSLYSSAVSVPISSSYIVASSVVSGSTNTPTTSPTESTPPPGNTGALPQYYAISGAILGCVILFVLVAFLLVYMKKRNMACFSKDIEVYGHFIESMEMDKICFRPGPIKLTDFQAHVDNLHRNDDLLFADAFTKLHDNTPKGVSLVAIAERNESKNRYVNILSFDHSRVRLHPIDDDNSRSDYINANFLPGYTLTREYIASQGPLPSTIDDFWRMTWDQNVDTIVMLTRLVENGIEKCDKYWPDIGNVGIHGDLCVTTKTETNTAKFTLRTMELGKAGSDTRTVRQYAFLQWPDMGCPAKTSYLLDFVKVVRRNGAKKDSNPILVHCSAGVGRTGTFIAVDYLLQFIRENDEIDIYHFVLDMRKYRTNMVQTETQLVYIYDCIKDYMLADDDDYDDSDADEGEDDEEDEGVEADRMLKDANGYDNPAFE